MTFFDTINEESPEFQLRKALTGIESRYGLKITIHDCRGTLYNSAGKAFFPERMKHMHPYCITGRYEISGWNKQCHENCMLYVEAKARRLQRPFTHECWKGVTELVVPVLHKGLIALILYAGLFRTPKTEVSSEIPNKLQKIWHGLPLPDETAFAGLSLELQLFGQGILYYVDQYRDRAGTPQGRHDLIRRFLEDHAHEQITLNDLAKTLNLSKTHLCHLVKFHFGESFHSLLNKERITRACNLLCSTDMPLKMIASATGFENEFYFSRIFTRECGMPPGKYRKEHRKK